jgi:hypothetical protein
MAQFDETTDYGKLLAIFSALDPQQVDTTPSAPPFSMPRLILAKRLNFIFLRDGRLASYAGLKGEGVNLVSDASRSTGKSDYYTMVDVLAPYTEGDVQADAQAEGGPRITLSGRSTFVFTLDGCLRGFIDGAQERSVHVIPVPPRPKQPDAPAQNAEPQRERMRMPARPQQEEDVAASETPGTPWPQRKG